MAVSKRLRFEILNRDNHTCRYCGGRAPDVTLTVDHVVPVALGGSDDPSNLVAACKDCNAGKSSSHPDAPLVDTVADDALRWARAMALAAEEMCAQLDANADIHEKVLNAWPSFRREYLPVDWTADVDKFLAAGLPADILIEMADLAGWKQGIYHRWSYFCGCCWTKVRQLQERAAELVAKQETDGESDG